MRPRGKRDQAGNERLKPACVHVYNWLMGGVDSRNQLTANHRSARKSIKWYKKLYFLQMDLTLVNCYAVSRLSAVKSLSWTFVENSRSMVPAARCQLPAALTEQVGLHFPRSLERKNNGDFRYWYCINCSAQGRQKKTHFECDTCRQPLCIDPCFREHHAP